MADIGLNQNISIRNRKFHFQTATNIEDGIIRTEVFEQGRLMYAQDNRYERRGSGNPEGGETRLRQSLDQFHRSIISSLKVYFDISDISDKLLLFQTKCIHQSPKLVSMIFLSL